MAEYDLTQKLIPHLDRHLAIPLLGHLSDIGLFPAEQLTKAQYDLVKGTNMVDYVKALHDQLPAGAESRDFEKLRGDATRRYEELQKQAQPVIKVIEDPEAVAKLKSGLDKERNLQLLETEYHITLEQINALYHFGQYQYTLGAYGEAANFLYHFLIFSPSFDLSLSAHWGKLASNILSGQWEAALADVKDLRDVIDTQANPLTQLQARTWLLHWSLFVHFNLGETLQGLLDMFLAPAYLNTIQTSCPHLLRYVVAAAILNRKNAPTGRRGNHIRDLVRITQMEEYQYTDPVTAFLKDLYVDFDFDAAKDRLATAEQVVRNDFFLSGFVDEFVENARWLVSEVYCRIHQRIDIGALSTTLNLSPEDGEKWIVNLIRDSHIDAKIDLKQNILLRSQPPAPAPLIDLTRGLAFRSQAIQYAMAGRKRRE